MKKKILLILSAVLISFSLASCSGMKNPSEISLSEAENRGLEPCKKCY